jgi:L-alanine-DL-glutamate epimerase-like enolase superfamily enzyme
MQLTLHVVPLRLRHTFTIAHGSTDLQHNLIVELRDGEHRGFGEASTVGYYSNSGHTMAASLERLRSLIEADTVDEPAAFWQRMAPLLRDDPFALCALDQAAHDLWGRRLGQPVWRLWGLDLASLPPSDYTIGIAPVEEMVRKLREFPDFPIYKIKLGTPDDLAIVRALRAVTNATFRVDANCAWDAATTIRFSEPLRELGVEFIEQPLRAADLAGQREVFARSALPVIADESCQDEADVDRCAGLFHGVNIKLTKCGGLTPARRMIARARELGLRVMVGCMTESTVGISAIGQLLPLLDYADMDGALLLADDVADGVRVAGDGRVHFPGAPGLGITWRGLRPVAAGAVGQPQPDSTIVNPRRPG